MAPVQPKRSVFIDSDSYEPIHTGGKPSWIYPAYYAVAGYYALSGVIGILSIVLNKKTDMSDPITIAVIAIHSIGILIGIGLMAKVELVRGIVNIFSFLKILGGLQGILESFGIILWSTAFGVFHLIFSVFDLCAAVLMIYLIGETD